MPPELNIIVTIICFLMGIVLGGFLARKRVKPDWTIDQEIKWWIGLFTGK